MTSAIDPTLPIHGLPTTVSVRNNFQIAHDEISALQAANANGPFLPIIGGNLTAALRIATPVDAGLGYMLDVTGTAHVSGLLTLGGGISSSGGTITSGINTLTAPIQLNGPAAVQRSLIFQTAGVQRFRFAANATAEAGSNAGSDLDLITYTDAGAQLLNPAFRITRATGLVTIFGGGLRVNGNAGFNNTAPIAKPTVSGAKGSNAALGSLLTALVAYGLITDTTTA